MKRIARRRVIAGGAALGAAAAVGSVAALSRRDGAKRPVPADGGTPGPTSASTSPATPTPSPPRGGVARLASPAGFNFDTFDAVRSGEPSTIEVLGRTHSRLLQWADFAAARLEGDVVERWEQPAPDRLVLHLRAGARWHPRPPLDGRALTAADVVAHLERVRQLAAAGDLSLGQRAWDYARITRISAPAERQVVIETAAPDPLLVGTLAGRYALVQAPEAVEALARQGGELEPGAVVGTGSFIFRGFGDDGTLLFDAHRDGHRPPWLDGLEVSQPYSVADRFLAGELDEALTRDRRDASRLRSGAPGVAELSRFEESAVSSSFHVGAAPWNSLQLRRALNAALNRGELSRRLFGGRAAAAGPVAPALAAFALPEAALAAFPGYRADFASDWREARALWEAGGGPTLGPVTIDFPSIFDPLFSASSVVTGMLNEALGVSQFRPAIESYVAISRKAAERRYGNGNAALWFGWGPPLQGPDPAAFLHENYHSASGGAATTDFRSPQVDRLLDELRADFDSGRRRDLIARVQRELLEAGGGGVIDWVLQRSELFRRPWLGGRPGPVSFWDQHLDGVATLDPSTPGFGSRAQG